MPVEKTPAGRFDRFKASPVRKRVWSAGRLLVLAGALIVTYGLFFLAAMRVATNAREVRVPDLRGKSVAEASELLLRAGLALKIDPLHRAEPSVPADHVFSQDPEAGALLRRQRSVRIRVSDGARAPILPSVVGLAERTADSTLGLEHVQIGTRAEIRTDSYLPGTIVAQTPPAKSRAATVDLLINRGGEAMTYVMPDLIGTLGQRAAQVLRAQQFRVSLSADAPYPNLPPGIVVRQTPAPGFQIAYGETISLEMTGPPRALGADK